ncbi:MAG: HD-GYP domain-containing protein [Candidatus Omnitrophica bacterium]|nr:HD-GYP domain-containing protein [Candidatus Omnitrophota bacterium]
MKISKALFSKKVSLEDIGLQSKNALAFLFMFVIPTLLACYLIFLAPLVISDKNMLLRHTRTIIILMSVCGLFGYLFLRKVFSTLIGIIKKAEYISFGNKGEKIEVVWNDELKDLAQSFNRINAGLETKVLELSRSIEKTYYDTLVMLARIVEAKDTYSAGHLERVSSYVQMIAKKLGLEEEAERMLMGGALLHDLGKVGIEDAILKKKGQLTPQEYEIVKQHSVIGENILKPLHSMSKLSILVRHHHEFYDGTGYPDGLKGEEIPLAARILTVVDIYDALITDRSYRKALSHDEGIKMLRKYAGNKLDPKLVEMFIGLITNNGNAKR